MESLLFTDFYNKNNNERHVVFDPIVEMVNLKSTDMDKNIQQQFQNVTPWGALTKVIGIPVLTIGLLLFVKINFFFKILLVLLMLLHIIIATCFISYVSKRCNLGEDVSSSSSSSTTIEYKERL